jgi:hypothetical protein
MIVDQQKLRSLTTRPEQPAAAAELRREENVFFLGGGLLPARETLETLFDSYCQAPADLFHLTFTDLNHFHQGEELARQIKKNFSARLLGRLDFPAPPFVIERAYAAGVDIVDIPLRVFDQGLAKERGIDREERLHSIHYARTVFPKWSVAATLLVGEEPSCSAVSGIDFLLGAGIVPLAEVSPRAAHYPAEEIGAIFAHLAAGWKKHRVMVKPLLPLLNLTTPLVATRPRGLLRGFIDKVYDRQLLATSDLRRSLRVKQVEESFESAGL